MTEADQIFERFPEFIREYIFTHKWESLRAVQIAAARTLFLTDHHLLLTSSTASGKTEAAFFPILSDLWENPPQSVGCLYVAPLKSLINDQFGRISELCDEAGIPVYCEEGQGGYHGFAGGEGMNMEGWPERMIAWLEGLVK